MKKIISLLKNKFTFHIFTFLSILTFIQFSKYLIVLGRLPFYDFSSRILFVVFSISFFLVARKYLFPIIKNTFEFHFSQNKGIINKSVLSKHLINHIQLIKHLIFIRKQIKILKLNKKILIIVMPRDTSSTPIINFNSELASNSLTLEINDTAHSKILKFQLFLSRLILPTKHLQLSINYSDISDSNLVFLKTIRSILFKGNSTSLLMKGKIQESLNNYFSLMDKNNVKFLSCLSINETSITNFLDEFRYNCFFISKDIHSISDRVNLLSCYSDISKLLFSLIPYFEGDNLSLNEKTSYPEKRIRVRFSFKYHILFLILSSLFFFSYFSKLNNASIDSHFYKESIVQYTENNSLENAGKVLDSSYSLIHESSWYNYLFKFWYFIPSLYTHIYSNALIQKNTDDAYNKILSYSSNQLLNHTKDDDFGIYKILQLQNKSRKSNFTKIHKLIFNDSHYCSEDCLNYFSSRNYKNNHDFLESIKFNSKSIMNRLSTLPSETLLKYEFMISLNDRCEFLFKNHKTYSVFEKNNFPRAIPFYYTNKGYKKLFKKDIFNFISNINLIFGTNHFSNDDNIQLEKFWKAYDQLYIDYWDNILNSLSLKPAYSLKDLVNLVSDFDRIALDLTLSTARDNSFPFISERKFIFDHFKNLNDFTGYPGKPSDEFKKLKKCIQSIKLYLQMILDSNNIDELCFNESKKLFSDSSTENPISEALLISTYSPTYIKRIVCQLAERILSVIFNHALNYIDKYWNSHIYSFYEKEIASFFPFNPSSQHEISPKDLQTFLKSKDGIFQFLDLISIFSDIQHLHSNLKSDYSYTFPLDMEKLHQLQNIVALANNGLLGGSESLSYSLVTRYLDPRAKSISFYIGDAEFSYHHGPQDLSHFSWPSDLKQVNIEIYDFKNQLHSSHFEGEWALFRFLSAGHCKNINKQLLCEQSIDGYKFSYEFRLPAGNISSTQLVLPKQWRG